MLGFACALYGRAMPVTIQLVNDVSRLCRRNLTVEQIAGRLGLPETAIMETLAILGVPLTGEEITEQTREAITAWIAAAHLKPEQFLSPSRVSESPHLSTRQYSRIVGSWVGSIGLNPGAYGTHSLRRTKPTLIYRRTKNRRAVQLLLGHSKLESTVRYLGIEIDDALEIAEQTEV